MDFFQNFKWAVPRALSGAVGACRFELGDVLYSEPEGYDPWAEGCPGLRYHVQVLDPPKTSRALSADQSGSRFAVNWGSRIELALSDRTQGTHSRYITTQGRLFMCLWQDDLSFLDEATSVPDAPLLQRELHGRLEDGRAFFEKVAKGRPSKRLCMYVAAIDQASDASRLKARAVEAALAQGFSGVKVHSLSPKEAGLDPRGRFHPSLELQLISVPTLNPEAVVESLRPVLYVGTGSRFSISRHGLLLGPVTQ